MQFTTLFVASVMALAASAAPQQAGSKPRAAQCADAGGAKLDKNDCQIAIAEMLKKPSPNGICNRMFVDDSEYATVRTCTVSVKAPGGDAHCQEPRDVASGAAKIIQACVNGGEAFADAKGSFSIVVEAVKDDAPVWN